MKIKELPKEFEKNGVRYTLVERNLHEIEEEGTSRKDGYMIYRCENIEFGYVYYEVLRYRTATPHPMSGEDYDLVEIYPKDEGFGVVAWCCSDMNCVKRVLNKHFQS